ncbi:DNA-processing protein DprA [Clostridium cadaveris]|uniref:DNA-processing protein DprA n=1 Tax=Clostridium cadaveris TaxID=1529 RepID=UPI0015B40075|nr:DNA-processing protein DprA [Clostridium cadaveris]NWK12847.1 DNA-protecting protein DprA [Clostridium cadaveris]
MFKEYYIALKLLNLSNEVIITIMKTLELSEIKLFFESDNIMEFQYKYNLNLNRYADILNNLNLKRSKLNEAVEIMNINKRLNIKTVLYINKLYPERLREINNPPAIIYIKGKNLNKNDLKSIACVGSRKISKFGVTAIESIVKNLTMERFTIISGLAYGADKTAHEVCLKQNGRTIAVVAHGLDMIYPKEHEIMAKMILENGGTIISEYPVGTKIEKFRFVERNRIVSALSSGILMAEAKEKSGTRHTIDFALEQKKPIFVPLPVTKNEINSLNFELIENRQAIPIKYKSDFSIIVKKLGYKIKYNKEAVNNLKNNSLNNVILSLSKGTIDIDVTTLKNKNARTGFDVNKEEYMKFKNILKENNLTLREFFNILIKCVIGIYEGEKRNE